MHKGDAGRVSNGVLNATRPPNQGPQGQDAHSGFVRRAKSPAMAPVLEILPAAARSPVRRHSTIGRLDCRNDHGWPVGAAQEPRTRRRASPPARARNHGRARRSGCVVLVVSVGHSSTAVRAGCVSAIVPSSMGAARLAGCGSYARRVCAAGIGGSGPLPAGCRAMPARSLPDGARQSRVTVIWRMP